MYICTSGEGVSNVIGPKLKEIRTREGMSQGVLSELAKQKNLKLSVATICKIERQQRSVYDYEVKILAEILGVSIDELYNLL